MSDEQWLREGLADAVPQPPGVPDRAQAAERRARHRRRTTIVAAAGAAAAVAAAVTLTVTLGGSGDDDADVASDPAPATVVQCPTAPQKGRDRITPESEVDRVDPQAPADVPEGATSARLCQGPGTALDAPDDALTTGVDDLVAGVNGLERTGEPQVCTMDMGPGFRIAFGYDDGSTFVVSGRLYGCRTLVVGSGHRSDPEQAMELFGDLLAEQG